MAGMIDAYFDRKRAIALAEALAEELAKLGDEPAELRKSGATLHVVKWHMQPLISNLKLGVYAYLEDGEPKTYHDFARYFRNEGTAG